MVVLATSNAIPVVVDRVLVAPVTLTVPPAVAVKAALPPVAAASPPLKLIVAPVLLARSTPVPLSATAPTSPTVPPVRLWIETEWPPPDVVMGAPTVKMPLPPRTRRPSPLIDWMATVESTLAALTELAATPAPDVA